MLRQINILVDVPDRSRKFHNRATPLTGGISIIVAALISGKLYLDFNGLSGYVPFFTFNLMVTSIVLVALFLIDDFKGLRASLRLVIQAALALYMIFSTDTYISNLGNMLGFGDLELGFLAFLLLYFVLLE